MNEANTKLLLQEFPEIFEPDFYFSVDDGWYELIFDCARALMDLKSPPRAAQVKEKFGELRFYIEAGTRLGANAITGFYEYQSGFTCEVCGSRDGGLCSTGYWLKTVCPAHRKTEDGREYVPRK